MDYLFALRLFYIMLNNYNEDLTEIYKGEGATRDPASEYDIFNRQKISKKIIPYQIPIAFIGLKQT